MIGWEATFSPSFLFVTQKEFRSQSHTETRTEFCRLYKNICIQNKYEIGFLQAIEKPKKEPALFGPEIP